MRRGPTLATLQKIVDKFNTEFPVGTKVILRMDSGCVETKVESPAKILGGHSAVRGCYAIEDRVSLLTKDGAA